MERARAWEWVKDPPPGEGQVGHPQHCRAVTSFPFREEGTGGASTIHLLIILLILPRSNMIYPFLVIEIPFYRFFNTLLKLERWLPAEFLLELARIDGITPIVTLSISNVGYNISSYKNKIKDGEKIYHNIFLNPLECRY